MNRETLLARTFVEIADEAGLDCDPDTRLSLLSRRSVEVLGVSSSGVMMLTGSALVVRAWSDAMARTLGLFELRCYEGPSRDCCRDGLSVLNRNLAPAEETPWPRWSVAALAAGYQTVHALPLRWNREVIGAVVLYHTERRRIDEAGVAVGQALADLTTIATLNQRDARDAVILTEQLRRALSSRVLVEQAKGIVAARFGLTVDAAFDRIRRHARSHNERIDAVARRIVDGPRATPVARQPAGLGPNRPADAVPPGPG